MSRLATLLTQVWTADTIILISSREGALAPQNRRPFIGRSRPARRRLQAPLHALRTPPEFLSGDRKTILTIAQGPPRGSTPAVQAAPIQAVEWTDAGLRLLDQTLLPREQTHLLLENYRDVVEAVQSMRVRGAPALGVAGGYGLALAIREFAGEAGSFHVRLEAAAAALRGARPTAVNLRWAVDRVLSVALREPPVAAFQRALDEAHAILAEDVAANHRIGEAGAGLLPPGSRVLTHCNTGALATGGWGTALGVVRTAWRRGGLDRVYLTESRPFLQGARLTAWEMVREGIPATLIVDAAAGHLLQKKRVDAVIVGADRIAANGDAANKIGTYSLAVLAKENSVPFYVAAPSSTIDLGTATGAAIPIEERSAEEVVNLGGTRVAAEGVGVWNPSFDVTPAGYIAGIITEKGIARAPFADSLPALKAPAGG